MDGNLDEVIDALATREQTGKAAKAGRVNPVLRVQKPSKRLTSKYTLQKERTMIRMEIKTRVLPADEAGVAEAAGCCGGQLVAPPTETVYGIAADITAMRRCAISLRAATPAG